MKIAYLSDASQGTVSEVVRDLLKARGALVTERTAARIRFVGLNSGSGFSFTKGGYVGVYQHVGEREAEVRFQVEATIPARMFWRTIAIELLAAILLFVINPDATVFALAAFVMWAAFIVVLLVYVGTWRSSRQIERELVDALVDRLSRRADAPKEILLEEDRLLRDFEETLEAEIVRLEIKARRGREPVAPVAAATPAGPKPTLGARIGRLVPKFGKTSKVARKADETPEQAHAKRERLLALKEELARRKAQAPPDEDLDAKRERLARLRADLERKRREGS